MTAIDDALRAKLDAEGLRTGTSLENRVAWRLHRWDLLDRCQYRVGKYRLDFAWPDRLVALEADGPFHLHPEMAAKDVVRDAYLRALGWLVFRVDEASNCLDQQLCRVARVLRAMDHHEATQLAPMFGVGDR